MEPESLHQPRIEGLPAEYPALKTLENGPTNLPVIRDATIGRERELREISALLGDEGVRVLTLTRPGGTGKTRLALQAAADLVEDCADGVFLVRLASISDPRLVLSAIAQSLAVREVADEDPACTLAAHLGQKRMLLVVDNFEQVLEAADGVSGLVAQCPGLRLLVTSRERLRVGGERVYAVPPLQLPGVDEPVQAIAASEAVALFVSRAEAATSSFAPTERDLPTIAEVCRMLDGLPLAIELAAARAPVLSPEALLRRLDRRLQFLTSGARDAEARQRTLRATGLTLRKLSARVTEARAESSRRSRLSSRRISSVAAQTPMGSRASGCSRQFGSTPLRSSTGRRRRITSDCGPWRVSLLLRLTRGRTSGRATPAVGLPEQIG